MLLVGGATTEPTPVAIATFGCQSEEGRKLLKWITEDSEVFYPPIDVRELTPRAARRSWKTGLDSSMNSIRLIHIESMHDST